MSLHPQPFQSVPEETARVARAASLMAIRISRCAMSSAPSSMMNSSPPCSQSVASQRKLPGGWPWSRSFSSRKGSPTGRRPMPSAAALNGCADDPGHHRRRGRDPHHSYRAAGKGSLARDASGGYGLPRRAPAGEQPGSVWRRFRGTDTTGLSLAGPGRTGLCRQRFHDPLGGALRRLPTRKAEFEMESSARPERQPGDQDRVCEPGLPRLHEP
jgi:hypothetical protein